MYSEQLLDHFQNPRNPGELGAPAVTVQAHNPACGDVLQLSVEFVAGTVTRVRFKAKGCTASIAAGSALTEWMQGKSRAELGQITVEMVEAAVGGLIPESKHAAVLCVDGVRLVLSKL